MIGITVLIEIEYFQSFIAKINRLYQVFMKNKLHASIIPKGVCRLKFVDLGLKHFMLKPVQQSYIFSLRIR
jgi:hypothetical protein